MQFFKAMSPSLGCSGLMRLTGWIVGVFFLFVLLIELQLPGIHNGVTFAAFGIAMLFPLVYNACLEDKEDG